MYVALHPGTHLWVLGAQGPKPRAPRAPPKGPRQSGWSRCRCLTTRSSETRDFCHLSEAGLACGTLRPSYSAGVTTVSTGTV